VTDHLSLHTMSNYRIEIADQQNLLAIDEIWLRDIVAHILLEEHVAAATMTVALVSDAEIRRINREFLGHDYPTDVISFRLDEGLNQNSGVAPQNSARVDREMTSHGLSCPNTDDGLEGELVISIETTIREASVHGWSAYDELVLYLVHGILHLCGYNDTTDDSRPLMRARERELLSRWQLVPTGLET